MKRLNIPENLTAMAYKSIRQYILEGNLETESRLTEEFLARQLGISKSPIREALNRLETEGLIRIEPRRGAYLRNYTAKESDELYDFREALEVHATRTAAITPVLVRELQATIDRQRRHLGAGAKLEYIQEDVAFHAKLAEATGNGLLRRELERLQNIIWLFRRDKYELMTSAAPDGHQRILDALDSGNRDLAQTEMRRHISRVRRHLVEEMQAREASQAIAAR